jgi:hypothetical protein
MRQEHEDYTDGEMPLAPPPVREVLGWLITVAALIAVVLVVFIVGRVIFL